MSESIKAPAAGGTLAVRILRLRLDRSVAADDRVAVEAPLEFQLHHPALGLEPVSFGTTMRTPGDDESLAAGLLYGEGIINRAEDIAAIETSTRRPNTVNVRLQPQVQIEVQTPARRFSAGSSCGVCGTTGLDAAIARAAATRIESRLALDLAVLLDLPARMRASQAKFGDTGGIHAAACFDERGALLGLAEDVGRHNAFDKLVGENLMAGRLPLSESHRVAERPGELRARAKSAARRRCAARRDRRTFEPRGQSRVRFRVDARRISARYAVQRLRQRAAARQCRGVAERGRIGPWLMRTDGSRPADCGGGSGTSCGAWSGNGTGFGSSGLGISGTLSLNASMRAPAEAWLSAKAWL